MKAKFITMLLAAVLLASCKIIPKTEVPEPTPAPVGTSDSIDQFSSEADEAAKDLGESSANLHKAAGVIDAAANEIVKKDPQGVMKPEVSAIKTGTTEVTAEADRLTQMSLGLYQAKIELGVATGQVQQLEEAVESRDTAIDYHKEVVIAKEAELAELGEAHRKALQRMLMYAVMAGLVTVAIAAMLVVNGNGKAVGFGVGGAVLSVAALGLSFFVATIAWIAVIALVIALGFVGYKVWEQRRDKRAQFELVKTVEKVKSSFDDEGKEALFGDLVGDGEVGALQSEATKQIVREHRERLANETRSII